MGVRVTLQLGSGLEDSVLYAAPESRMFCVSLSSLKYHGDTILSTAYVRVCRD